MLVIRPSWQPGLGWRPPARQDLAGWPELTPKTTACGVTSSVTTGMTRSATLERVAAVYRSGGWPASAEGNALTAPYSAPSAGPAPWHVYRLTLHTAVGVATAEPHGATRWDFAR